MKNGAINIQELFTIESVFDRVQEVIANIPDQVEYLKQIIKQEEIPSIDIGAHCDTPYPCDFKGHCWKHIPEYSIFDIANLWTSKKFELYEKGIITLDQIDLDDNSLNASQLMQVNSELNNTSYIDRKNISEFVKNLNYPLYFLDFETMGSAIPIYENTRPYQQFVFQYSLHILQEENGVLNHSEYLAETTTIEDPRTGFVNQLINDCGTSGDILVYNIGFERGKLNDLIELFPHYTNEINNIINRLKDLMIPFQKRWYYTPEMKGSYSIKYVLPALVPDLSYQDLEIKEGGTASVMSFVNWRYILYFC